ncbi:MAG: DNA mismatch repair protein MutS [Armatimonadota bacterium]|nr:DNA mismatch repair protein MutS [Armatimonadota bacterium]MDR7586980.1 DNA mismatch repair protein MutS [Armatimonadota bacterium]MDR7612374.1 DNA mismatch repair protein MutS [Armatimonadota bacterium]
MEALAFPSPSALFSSNTPGPTLRADPPSYFPDLLLDQVVNAITAGREEYDLKPFFYTPLTDVSVVLYRQEIVKDIEDLELHSLLTSFASAMRTVRESLAHVDKTYYERQQERWFLDAVSTYCDAVLRLAQDLSNIRLRSAGLVTFRHFLLRYTGSAQFLRLREEALQLRRLLSSIRYAVWIRGLRVEVRAYAGEEDYSAEITRTFARFRQADVPGHNFLFKEPLEINHVEAQVLDGVATLHPEVFSRLAAFRQGHLAFLDPTIAAFDREVQFYLGYLAYIAPLKQAGLPFCYPHIAEAPSRIYARKCFDLVLATKLLREGSLPVCNDFSLEGRERMLVVTGPNQGGKTTFARSIGQLHYLAALGCPVPGTEALLSLPDRISTHFEQGEHPEGLVGKLEDDLLRIREILADATSRSLLIINEIFSSTSLHDALFLSKRIASAILDLGAPCVWVTFLDELASLDEKTVSMVATVDPHNPEVRTFRIERRPADGLAYAMTLARKHRLTYEMIRERLRL